MDLEIEYFSVRENNFQGENYCKILHEQDFTLSDRK